MAEYIEKAAILSKCEEMWNDADETTQTGVDTINAIDRITDLIEAIPAADVKPDKRGKWDNEYLDDDIWWAECTACKEETHSRYGRVSAYNYCPNCGADMREPKTIKG